MKILINRIRLTNDAEDDDEDDDRDGHEHVNSRAKVGNAVPKVLSTLERMKCQHLVKLLTPILFILPVLVSVVLVGVSISLVKLTPSVHLSRGRHS